MFGLYTKIPNKLLSRNSSRNQSSDLNVVDDLLNLLHVVFQCIEPFAQTVILQIQQSKARTEIANETGYVQRSLVIAQCDRIYGKSGLKKLKKKSNEKR